MRNNKLGKYAPKEAPARQADSPWKGAEIMRLSERALKRWGFVRDPFADEPRSHDELFWSEEHTRTFNYVLTAVQRVDAVAVAAPVGWGKTFIRMAVEDALHQDPRKGSLVININAISHERVNPNLIQFAILRDIFDDPRAGKSAPPIMDSERLSTLVIERMTNRARQNNRLVLMIDEAHRLPVEALRCLKNLMDVRIGFQRVLAIILFGQDQELLAILRRNDIREVGARVQTITPGPLSVPDGEVRAYLRHRILIALRDRAPIDDAERDQIPIPFDESALVAIERILSPKPDGDGVRADLLTINAVCSQSLDYASDSLGVDVVTEDVVRQARARIESLQGV